MQTTRETVLTALFDRLTLLELKGVAFERNSAWRADFPDAGLVILLDGDPGEPEITMSPLTYHFEHRAKLEVTVQLGDREARDKLFDDLMANIGAVLVDDRTLGGLCDWIEPHAPTPVDLPVEGAAALKGAIIDVTLHYSTGNPLG